MHDISTNDLRMFLWGVMNDLKDDKITVNKAIAHSKNADKVIQLYRIDINASSQTLPIRPTMLRLEKK